MEYVIQVDEKDQFQGVIEKIEAHKRGILHRAVSVIIFNSNGEMLLQKRAIGKYHSGGLWSNTACTHPNPDETNEQASLRRVYEEMGITTNLSHLYSFIYKVDLDNGMIEHEFDHVFIGISDQKPTLNSKETSAFKYLSIQNLKEEIEYSPEIFSSWFKLIFNELLSIKPELLVA